jgi:hypothetical protein
MKKSLLILVITANWLTSYDPCSMGAWDGFPVVISSIKTSLSSQNSNLNGIWMNINNNQARKILEALKTKKELLTDIQTLSREDDIVFSNELYEIELKRELNGILIDVWSLE